MISINKCPNCGKKLERVSGKTTNCIYCDKRIYVRIRAKDEKRVLVDLAGVKQIDDEWIKYALQSNWFKVLKHFGITEKDYMNMHDNLTKKWGFNPRHTDIFWGLFNNILINSFKEGDAKKTKLIQEYMEKFNSERGKSGGTK